VETLQEQLVCTRKGTPKATMRIDFRLGLRRARTDAVGCKGVHAAQLQPGIKAGRIPEEILHQGFVIATQAHRAILHKPDRQQINDSLRIRAAIYVVAQIDLDRMPDRPALEVLINPCNGFKQQAARP
jgi:hypothetical protein